MSLSIKFVPVSAGVLVYLCQLNVLIHDQTGINPYIEKYKKHTMIVIYVHRYSFSGINFNFFKAEFYCIVKVYTVNIQYDI